MLRIDMSLGVVEVETTGGVERIPIGSPKAFALISKAWLRSGWDAKYVYGFSWMGRPVIQLPEDMLRIQEVIYRVKPDVVLETGIAHGGSLVYYASLLKAMGRGRVIGVDVEIRPHNRAAIESHELFPWITMIEGSSVDPHVVDLVHEKASGSQSTIVILDSNHSREHVLAEMKAYAPLVSVGSYLVACDGIMQDVVGAQRTASDWATNNPQSAVKDFLADRPDFVLEEPSFPFNEGSITQRVTYWPNAYLRRIA